MQAGDYIIDCVICTVEGKSLALVSLSGVKWDMDYAEGDV